MPRLSVSLPALPTLAAPVAAQTRRPAGPPAASLPAAATAATADYREVDPENVLVI